MKRNKELDDPRSGVYEITPAEASEILQGQNNNRRLRTYVVNRIAWDIDQGSFKYNGESVVFDYSGRLIQGQHRLRACVVTGKSIVVFVVFLPKSINLREIETTYDKVMPRSAGDALTIKGFSGDESLMSALVKKLLSWERYHSLGRHGGRQGSLGGNQHNPQRITHDDVVGFWRKHAEPLMEALDAVGLYARLLRGLVSPSSVAFVYFRAARRNQKLADSWLHGLATGENLSMGNPIWDLRRKLQTDATSKARLGEDAKTAYCIQAWNAHAQGQKKARLVWDPTRNEFPSFIGESIEKTKAKVVKKVKKGVAA